MRSSLPAILNSPDHILRRAKELEIEGRRLKGRPQITWLDCIKENLKEHRIAGKWTADREKWKNVIGRI